VICENKITYYINRTEYPLGLGQKSGLRRILFDRSCVRRIWFHKKSGLRRIFFIFFLLNRDAFDLKFLVLSTNFISGENDSNSNTE